MKKIELFDYQEDMKARIEKALCLHRSVMAQMPTGTGKTVLLASVVESFLREHSNCKVWIVAHRRELVSQIRETIERVFSKITPSLFTIKEGNFSKTHPSSLTLKGGSTAFPKPLFSSRRLAALGKVQASLLCTHLHNLSPQGTGDVTALRCSEPLRSKVGGPSKVSPDCLSAGASKEALAGSISSLNSISNASDEIEVLVSVEMTQEGFTYTPLVIKTHKRSRWL